MQARKARIVWTAEAEQDLVDIWGYVAQNVSPNLADQQLRSIDAACQRLGEWPSSGRSRDELGAGVRSIPVHPYAVFYRSKAGRIEVARVLHARRDVGSAFAIRKP